DLYRPVGRQGQPCRLDRRRAAYAGGGWPEREHERRRPVALGLPDRRAADRFGEQRRRCLPGPIGKCRDHRLLRPEWGRASPPDPTAGLPAEAVEALGLRPAIPRNRTVPVVPADQNGAPSRLCVRLSVITALIPGPADTQ